MAREAQNEKRHGHGTNSTDEPTFQQTRGRHGAAGSALSPEEVGRRGAYKPQPAEARGLLPATRPRAALRASPEPDAKWPELAGMDTRMGTGAGTPAGHLDLIDRGPSTLGPSQLTGKKEDCALLLFWGHTLTRLSRASLSVHLALSIILLS